MSTASGGGPRPDEDFEVYGLVCNGEASAASGQGTEESKSQEGQECVGIWVTMEITAESGRVVEALGPIMAQTDS